MTGQALVSGIGRVKFSKPGTQEPYPAMTPAAIRDALADAGIGLEQVEQSFAGY